MFIINLIAIFFFYSNLQCKDIITIEIDGSNLPNANGSIEVGEKIYKKNCSECHGYSGEGLTAPELVGKSELTGDRISKSIGNGISVEDWLAFSPQQSLELFMFQNPNRAKKLYFDIIPKMTDDYIKLSKEYESIDSEKKINIGTIRYFLKIIFLRNCHQNYQI